MYRHICRAKIQQSKYGARKRCAKQIDAGVDFCAVAEGAGFWGSI